VSEHIYSCDSGHTLLGSDNKRALAQTKQRPKRLSIRERQSLRWQRSSAGSDNTSVRLAGAAAW